VLVGNGVLTPTRTCPPGGEKPQLTLRLRREVLVAVLAARTMFPEAIAAGDIGLDGDITALSTLTDLLEAPDRNFAVVVP
jgi:alkyl sulfatase BDS1-like metallo-beta-lactamase superfamily hydrolase